MRYYEIPDRPVTDPVTGATRPTRVSRFAGGPESTRFVDPETGAVYRAIRVDVRYDTGYTGTRPGWRLADPSWEADRKPGCPPEVDYRYPVDPGMKYRVRKDGSVRPIGWKKNN